MVNNVSDNTKDRIRGLLVLLEDYISDLHEHLDECRHNIHVYDLVVEMSDVISRLRDENDNGDLR